MIAADLTGPEAAAILAGAGLVCVSAFQVAIALGAPLGSASWGGRHEGRLPTSLRRASAIAAVLWLIAAGIVLGRVGIGPVPGSVARWGTWALVALLTVGAVMNAASPSRWERFGWAPFTALLAGLCVVVARS